MDLLPVREGDIVDIVAPASRCATQELQSALKALKALGLVPRVPPNLFGARSLLSNTDEVRLSHLKAALYAPDSPMIWCVRGGYGCLRLLPQMARWRRPRQAKIVLGYSDITTLHSFLNQTWQWPSLHGPLLDRLGRGAMSVGEKRELLRILWGKVRKVHFQNLVSLNAAARLNRTLKSSIVGGNMAVVQSGLGTPWQLKPEGKILFFEDTGERPHRVDRMLEQFRQAGFFHNSRAVVFGHYLLSDPADRRQLWAEVIPRFLRSVRLPVLRGLPVGHDPKKQYTLPLGTTAFLQLGRKPTLSVRTGIDSLY